MTIASFRLFVGRYVHDSRFKLDEWFPQNIRDVFYQQVTQVHEQLKYESYV